MAEGIDVKKATKEEIELGLQLLAKKKDYEARVKRGELKGTKKWKDLTPEEKAKANLATKKAAVRQKMLLAKAAAQGIKVSEAEVDAEIKKLGLV